MLLNSHTHRLRGVWPGCLLPSAMAWNGLPAVRVRLWRPSGSTTCSTVVGLVP